MPATSTPSERWPYHCESENAPQTVIRIASAIAQSKDTSLAIVAPGIAEALFATALGLAAAIPAVVAYNQIAVALGRAAARANAAAVTLARALARPGPRPAHVAEAV